MNPEKREYNGWILCPSTRFLGKFYYFNPATGEAVWNLSDMERRMASHQNFAHSEKWHAYPEPDSPPEETSNPWGYQPDFRVFPQASPPFGQPVFPKYAPHAMLPSNMPWGMAPTVYMPAMMPYQHQRPMAQSWGNSRAHQKQFMQDKSFPNNPYIQRVPNLNQQNRQIFSVKPKINSFPVFSQMNNPNRDVMHNLNREFINSNREAMNRPNWEIIKKRSHTVTENENNKEPLFKRLRSQINSQNENIFRGTNNLYRAQSFESVIAENDDTPFKMPSYQQKSNCIKHCDCCMLSKSQENFLLSSHLSKSHGDLPNMGKPKEHIFKPPQLQRSRSLESLLNHIPQSEVSSNFSIENSFVFPLNKSDSKISSAANSMKKVQNSTVSQSGQDKIASGSSDDKLSETDLRYILMARRKKSSVTELQESGKQGTEAKKIKTSYSDTNKQYGESFSKKRVTFDLGVEDMVDEDNVDNPDVDAVLDMEIVEPPFEEQITKVCYVVADLDALLTEFDLIENFVKSDKSSILLIPAHIARSIESTCAELNGSRNRVIAARQISRHIARQVIDNQTHIQVQTEDSESVAGEADDLIINCCLKLYDKGHNTILITNNEVLYNKATSDDVECYTTEEIKEYMGTPKPEVSFDIQKVGDIDNGEISTNDCQPVIPVNSSRNKLFENACPETSNQFFLNNKSVQKNLGDEKVQIKSQIIVKNRNSFLDKDDDLLEDTQFRIQNLKLQERMVSQNSQEESNLKLQERIDKLKMQLTIDSEKLQERIDRQKLKKIIDGQKMQGGIDGQILQERINSKNLQERIDTQKLQERIDSQKLQERINRQKLQERTDSQKLQERMNSQKLQERIDSQKLQEIINSQKLQERIDSQKLQERINSQKLKERIDNQKLQERINSQKLQERIDCRKLQERINSQKLQERIDRQKLQERIDRINSQKLQERIDRQKLQERIDNLRLQVQIDTHKKEALAVKKKQDAEKENANVFKNGVEVEAKEDYLKANKKLKNINVYNLEGILKSFSIKSKDMEERIMARMDEYVCNFCQIMEAILENIVKDIPGRQSEDHIKTPVQNQLIILREIIADHRTASALADKLSAVMDKAFVEDKQHERLFLQINPNEFVKMFACGTLLIKVLRSITDDASLQEGEVLLEQLERSLEHWEFEAEPCTPVTPGTGAEPSSEFKKHRYDVLEFLMKNCPQWKYYKPKDNEIPADRLKSIIEVLESREKVTSKVITTSGKHLNLVKLKPGKPINFSNNKENNDKNKNNYEEKHNNKNLAAKTEDSTVITKAIRKVGFDESSDLTKKVKEIDVAKRENDDKELTEMLEQMMKKQPLTKRYDLKSIIIDNDDNKLDNVSSFENNSKANTNKYSRIKDKITTTTSFQTKNMTKNNMVNKSTSKNETDVQEKKVDEQENNTVVENKGSLDLDVLDYSDIEESVQEREASVIDDSSSNRLVTVDSVHVTTTHHDQKNSSPNNENDDISNDSVSGNDNDADDENYDSGIESSEAYSLVQLFLFNLNKTLLLIKEFMWHTSIVLNNYSGTSINHLRNDISDRSTDLMNQKCKMAQDSVMKIINNLNNIIERESNPETALRPMLLKAGPKAVTDKRIIKYRRVISKCLSQARVLHRSLQILQRIAQRDLRMRDLSDVSDNYSNLFE